VIGVRIELSREKLRLRDHIIIFVVGFSIATIFNLLQYHGLKMLISSYVVMGILATVVTYISHMLDRGESSIIVLKEDTIEFRGSATSNKEIELSDFDRLYYREGFFRSFVQLERDEGERPNWYRANGRPADEDRKKLEKLIEIANSKMKDK